MRREMTGVLQGSRLLKQRRGGGLLDRLLADLIAPQFYEPQFYVIDAESHAEGLKRSKHVWSLRGKGVDGLTLEDIGRPIKVTGDYHPNQSYAAIGRGDELGRLLRVKWEFLDSECEVVSSVVKTLRNGL